MHLLLIRSYLSPYTKWYGIQNDKSSKKTAAGGSRVTTIEMKGELSIQNAEELHNIFLSALQKKGDILLDFSNLEDIDVSTIQLIYSMYISCKDHKLEVKGPIAPQVKQRLYTCGLISAPDLDDDSIITAIIDKMRAAHE